jgi:hypothetical protein
MRRTFVVGCPRSGTTLVQAMLARHPDVFSLPETYFFDALIGDTKLRWQDREARSTRRWYHRAGMAQSWGRHHLRDLERVHLGPQHAKRLPRRWRSCVSRFTAMLDEATRRSGRRVWVEKTPTNLLYIDEIEATIPDAYFVHVLRDGMDVVASIIDGDMRLETGGFRGGIARWARRWNRAMELHKAHMGEARHHFLCLEDLIANPSGEWETIRALLGLDNNKPLLEQPGCSVADTEEFWKDDAVTGVVRPVESKVRAVFGPQSIAWLEGHLADYRPIREAVRGQRRRSAAARAKNGGPRGETAQVRMLPRRQGLHTPR